MACYFPWSQSLGSAVRPLACGQCIGCRLEKARQWAVRIMHEASLWRENSFVTLTYAASPVSLVHRDYQLFQKRLVKWNGPTRFYMCGEYGPTTKRPHYHAVLFGCGFADKVYAGRSSSGEKLFRSDKLSELWGHGHVSLGDVTFESAGYVARYVVDKVTGDQADEHYGGRVPEYSRCSTGGRAGTRGIGYAWFDRYGGSDVRADGKVVVNGHKAAAPRYYRKLLRERFPRQSQRLAAEGAERVVAGVVDSSDERLAVKEQVKRASLRSLKRSI